LIKQLEFIGKGIKAICIDETHFEKFNHVCPRWIGKGLDKNENNAFKSEG